MRKEHGSNKYNCDDDFQSFKEGKSKVSSKRDMKQRDKNKINKKDLWN